MHLQYRTAFVAASAALVLGTIASCGGVSENESGRVAARGTGDISAEPLERAPFDRPLIDACGGGAALATGTLARKPYLQQVTESGATVVWTTLDEAPMGLEVTLPDGTPVVQADAALDPSVSGGPQRVATVTGLEPGTTYCYRVVDDGGAVTDWAGFRTAPPTGGDAAVTFVALGDMGSGSPDQYAVLEQLRRVPFDLMLTTGDNAYDDGTLAELEERFFDVYAPVLQSAPVYPAAGNHDYRTDSAGPYRDVFVLPDNGVPGKSERWYSFDRGDVHFVVLDSELVGSEQLTWLEGDLATNEREWTVATVHEPPYSSGEHGSAMDVREELCPLLERHGVDLVLSGHDHDYERTVPMNGPVYVVTGGGGVGTRPVGLSSFTAYAEDVLHFVWVRVEGDALHLRAIDATGREFDSVRIQR